MDRRMRVFMALTVLTIYISPVIAFVVGADGPVTFQEALENGNVTLFCDSSTDSKDDELMLLVWYKDNDSIYSFDARVGTEWCDVAFNASGRIIANMSTNPTTFLISALREDDQALYHCRVEFLLSPTRNVGINLTVTVLPSQPFFLDELGNTVTNKTRPYYEGDTLVLTCLVIGGRPPPKISWYSGEMLVDATDSISDIPNVRQNELYLPLTRDNANKLFCKATNTQLIPPLESSLQIEMYLPADNVTVQWIQGASNGVLHAGKVAVARCLAHGSYPIPDLIWSLNHKLLLHHSNQKKVVHICLSLVARQRFVIKTFVMQFGWSISPLTFIYLLTWDDEHQVAISHVHFIPTVADYQTSLRCEAINPIMPPERNSKSDSILLNVTFAPVVEIVKHGEEERNEVAELDSLRLKCVVQSNPPVIKFMWYFNDSLIKAGGIWGDDIYSNELTIEETKRKHTGKYACGAKNTIGETRADPIEIIVFYPPECVNPAIILNKQNLICNVKALPVPDTYFWHIYQIDHDSQHLTTGSASLPLNQVSGPFSNALNVSCEAENGIASQEKSCTKIIKVDHLRPPQLRQCDIVFEYKEFQIKCIPVENATHYELSLWRLSTTNTSLVLDQKRSIEVGNSLALTQNEEESMFVRAHLGLLRAGDEASAAACNRYGCSTALLLRPTENLLSAAVPPWWKFFTERDTGISVGVVLLVVMFVCSSILAVRLARRARAKASAPVIQVLQLDDVTRDYLTRTGDIRMHPSGSLRSISSDYSDGAESPSFVDYHCAHTVRERIPPPDVTLTLQRESAV